MFYIPRDGVDYPNLKSRLYRYTPIFSSAVTLTLFCVSQKWALAFLYGSILGLGYLWSLFLSTEAPKRKLTTVITVLRMVTVSFLIVWLGHFELHETCIVFLGFLSYKVVLVLEYVRYSVGMKLSRGN
jgi:hypothetical protein